MESQHRRSRISSSLGNVEFGESRRVLKVEDPTTFESVDNIQQIEEEIRQQKVEHLRAPKPAINRLELLVGLGRTTTEIEVGGTIFGLKSLKNRELKDVIMNAAGAKTAIEEALIIRNCTLAYALYEVDGNPINLILGVGPENKENAVLELLEEMEEKVVAAIWAAYRKMDEENSEKKGDLGADDKEVVENIKKS